MDLAAAVSDLPERHRHALSWFVQRAGTIVPWPRPLADGTLLATKAKGIYKPSWSRYALSIRQTLGGPYPDRPVQVTPDGAWQYEYFQEGLVPSDRDDFFTNRGLMECYRDMIPIGVMIQTQPRPNVRYRILGLALINGVTPNGYFVLHGLESAEGVTARDIATVRVPRELGNRADLLATDFDPGIVEDERRRTQSLVVVRQGQPGFRSLLMDAYSRRCAVTSYEAVEALEAAHIVPYRGGVTNHPSNGLLLRADLHSLFDLGKIAVHERSYELLIAPELRTTKYSALEGITLAIPSRPMFQPSSIALARHREWAGL